jgi:all-trans-retinol 13,14-reductase
MSPDVIIIGSGIGGLTAGALLARYGKRVLICESHSIPGGAAHSFSRQGFQFDSGPSFFCGLGNQGDSINPLKQVLDVLGESVEAIPYDFVGHYHFPEGTFPASVNSQKYRQAVAQITPQGAKELENFEKRLLSLYDCLKEIPTIILRADWQILPILLWHYLPSLLKMLPQLPLIGGSVGKILDEEVRDPWVRRLIEIECFLLSGLKAEETPSAEVAIVFGERTHAGVEYPIGGSGAIVNALVRGFKRWGGELRLGTHVEQILVKSNAVKGIRLRNGETINAPIVISNASIWDTYKQLLQTNDLPLEYRTKSLNTPRIDSFMHLHLGIRAEGLKNLTGHHVVLHDANQAINTPGNTCMISIPSVWDNHLAPEGHHVIHAYTLEPYEGWQRNDEYEEKKKLRSRPLYLALEKIIPDIRARTIMELIGTPLTHSYFLRRYQGTYGPAIAVGKGTFPNCYTPISGLYRVGDSTLPGIGVPAVAISGIFCANSLVSSEQVWSVYQSQFIKNQTS